jgi:dihydropteroate synthase-like protein
MSDHILFLTGRLAEKSLHKVLESMQPTTFTYDVVEIGLQVAGLMTADLIRRRLADLHGATRVLVPGRCRGNLDALSQHYGVPVERGPDELKDVPQHFGRKAKAADLSKYDVLIFAEIVDAPALDIAGILARAQAYRRDGADVIDLGCLPETPFPHLEEAIQELKRQGYQVSVDSIEPAELRCGALAGADFLLSLKEDTLRLADELPATPVLIPNQPRDLGSLYRTIEALQKKGRTFYADPILDPIHFGFTESIVRYHELRRRFPAVPMMMGVGNLTELTDADTAGANALLMGIISELQIGALLTTQVSPHARRAVKEADAARRMMYAAREAGDVPKGYSGALLQIHDKKPFPDSASEIHELARQVKDPSFRVQVSEAGVHVYNRDGVRTATEAFALWPRLGLEQDAGHAFYMGVELARAQLAWQLGKRYVQDEELDWGVAAERGAEDTSKQKETGTTLSHDRHALKDKK